MLEPVSKPASRHHTSSAAYRLLSTPSSTTIPTPSRSQQQPSPRPPKPMPPAPSLHPERATHETRDTPHPTSRPIQPAKFLISPICTPAKTSQSPGNERPSPKKHHKKMRKKVKKHYPPRSRSPAPSASSPAPRAPPPQKVPPARRAVGRGLARHTTTQELVVSITCVTPSVPVRRCEFGERWAKSTRPRSPRQGRRWRRPASEARLPARPAPRCGISASWEVADGRRGRPSEGSWARSWMRLGLRSAVGRGVDGMGWDGMG